MFTKDIETLLQKNLGDTPMVVSGRSLRFDVDDLVAEVLPPSRIAVVDDKNTSYALGEHVFRALKGRFSATHITLERGISADDLACSEVENRSHGCDALIAVGSGTINDICKYVSFRNKLPYLVFPTAASMNGYVSANASITIDGYKQTLPAHMPKAVFCDMSVIAQAPARLSKSGLGDCLARPTAQTDWLMSHLLLGTPYSSVPFELTAAYEAQVFDAARGIASGDEGCISALTSLLLLSGFGMTIAGGSYPASQSEHMIAHAYEMLPHEAAQPTLHGEEIGITALAMAHRQRRLLIQPPSLLPLDFPADDIQQHFGERTAKSAKQAYYKKREIIEAAGLSRDTIASRWADIVGQLEKTAMKPETMESILKACNAPSTPQALGWDSGHYDCATQHARFLRDRFTCLDLG
jgi:glycerol-1-phosphate dehydrogenase [NAD(P)+]